MLYDKTILIYFKQSRNGSYYIINGWIKILYISYIKSYENKLIKVIFLCFAKKWLEIKKELHNIKYLTYIINSILMNLVT